MRRSMFKGIHLQCEAEPVPTNGDGWMDWCQTRGFFGIYDYNGRKRAYHPRCGWLMHNHQWLIYYEGELIAFAFGEDVQVEA